MKYNPPRKKNSKKQQNDHNRNHVYGDGIQPPEHPGMPLPDGKHNTTKVNQPK